MFHYLGNEKSVKRPPHGNATGENAARPFIPTSTKVTDKIAQIGLTQPPRVILQKDHDKILPGTLSQTESIRGTNQIKYVQQQLRDKLRLKKTFLKAYL